jgi:hypothetical protein
VVVVSTVVGVSGVVVVSTVVGVSGVVVVVTDVVVSSGEVAAVSTSAEGAHPWRALVVVGARAVDGAREEPTVGCGCVSGRREVGARGLRGIRSLCGSRSTERRASNTLAERVPRSAAATGS